MGFAIRSEDDQKQFIKMVEEVDDINDLKELFIHFLESEWDIDYDSPDID